jgi:hypothetical protein
MFSGNALNIAMDIQTQKGYMNILHNGCHSSALEYHLTEVGIKSEVSLSTSLHNTLECPMEHVSLQNSCHVPSVATAVHWKKGQ